MKCEQITFKNKLDSKMMKKEQEEEHLTEEDISIKIHI